MSSDAADAATRNVWGFVYGAGTIPDTWDTSPDALQLWRVVAFHQWTKSYHTVASVNRANRTLLFRQPAPYPYSKFVNNTASARRFYIEGVKEIPLAPNSGQWRLTQLGGTGTESTIKKSADDHRKSSSRIISAAGSSGRSAGGGGYLLSYAPRLSPSSTTAPTTAPTAPIAPTTTTTTHAPSFLLLPSSSSSSSSSPPLNAVLPRLSSLIRVGNAANVSIDGITLRYTDVQCPETASSSIVGTTCDTISDKTMTGQLLAVTNSPNLRVSNCTLVGAGSTAVLVSRSHGAVLTRLNVLNAGGAGVVLNGCDGNASLTDSRVHGAGQVVANAPGLQVSNCKGALVSHCEAAGVAHTRGLRWDNVNDAGAYTNISFNHIHDCGCGSDDCLSDGGGLDGASPHSKLPVYLHRNLVHNVQARNFGGAGIYLDVSSNAVQVEGNVVFGVGDQPFYWNIQPGGQYPLQEGAVTTRVVGNVFVKDTFDAQRAAPWVNNTPVIQWKAYRPGIFRSNIVAELLSKNQMAAAAARPPNFLGTEPCLQEFKKATIPPVNCSSTSLGNFAGGDWDNNVYFRRLSHHHHHISSSFSASSSRSPPRPPPPPPLHAAVVPAAQPFLGPNTTWEAWRAAGFDVHSLVGDPLFRNATSDDYRLQPNSPAIALGHVPWDWKVPGAVGPTWGG